MSELLHKRYALGSESLAAKLIWGPDGGSEIARVVEEGYPQKGRSKGETCIPPGSYKLGLRTEGGMHGRYAGRWGQRHRGMLWILDIPGRTFVYYHIGNNIVGRDDDSLGCPLVNTVAEELPDGNFIGRQSVTAYWKLYEVIVPFILRGEEVFTHITDNELWE